MKTNFKSIATKTMIASAIASMMAGAAFADEAATTPAEPSVKLENSMTISSDLTIDKTTTGDDNNSWGSEAETGVVNWQINSGKVSIKDYYLGQKKPAVGSLTGILTIDGGTIDISGTDTALVTDADNKNYVAGFEVNHIEINGGTINLSSTTKDGKIAASALGAYDSFVMNGGTINIGADAMVWMTTDGEGWSEVGTVEGSGTMKLNGGTVNISGGKLAAGDATADDTMLLAGTNVNVNAEKSTLEANTIKQTAGTIHVTKGDLTIQSAYTKTDETAASYTMTGGAVIADAGTTVTFDTALNASDDARLETTDGQIRLMKDATISGGTINLTATAENLKANDGKGYFDGVGLIVGDQGQAQTLTLGSTNTNLIANVKDGAHIDSFGTMTINGGTFNVGGALNGSVNNDPGMGQAWRQGSQIYSEDQMTIAGGTFNLGQNALLGSATGLTVDDAVINMNGTKDAVSMIGAWGASSLNDGVELNVNGAGVIKLASYAEMDDKGASFSVGEGAAVNVADGATLVVTRTLDQFYDTAAEGQTSKGLITVPAGMTGLVVTDGTFNIAGDVVAHDVTVGAAAAKALKTDGTLAISDHGFVETTNLVLDNKGKVTVAANGELYVKDGISLAEGIKADDKTIDIKNEGSVYAKLSQLGTIKIADTDAKSLTFEKNGIGTLLSGTDDTGTFYDFGEAGTFRISQYNALQTAWGTNGDLVLLNATITDDKDGMLTFDSIDDTGLVSPNTSVSANLPTGSTDKTVTLAPQANKDIIVANVVTDAETVKVDSSNNGLTLAGTGGVLFGDAVKTVDVTGTHGLTLGYNDAMEYKGGQINAAVSVGENSNVTAEAGTWRINNDVTLATGAKVGTADSDANLTVTGAVKGTGTLEANDGMLSVSAMQNGIGITAKEGGVVSVSSKYVDPDAQTPDDTAFYGAISVGQISHQEGIIGLGTSSAESAARIVQSIYGDDIEGKNILVLQSQVSGTNVVMSNEGTAYTTNVIVDLGAVAQTPYFNAEDGVINGALSLAAQNQLSRAQIVDGTPEIVLTNLTNAALTTVDKTIDGQVQHIKALRLATSSQAGINVDYGTLFYGNRTMDQLDYALDEAGKMTALKNYGTVETDGTVLFQANESALDLVSDLNVFGDIKNSVEGVSFGQNEIADAVVFGLDDYIVKAYNETVDLGLTNTEDRNAYIRGKLRAAEEAVNTASNMAVAGGAFSTAIDINNEVWKALDRRTSLANLNAARNANGVTPWVDVIGTWNTADSLFGDSGYEADIYGAVIGADWTAPCGAILGLAFNVGQADGNSTDSPVKVENDVDFWGVSLYGSHQIGKFNGKFDLGYLSTSNDLSTHTVLGSFDESLDADIFTVGLGGEYIVNAGSFNVVPHAGIRWSRIDMDDSKFGADYDAMNLFQMPIGVAFSGTFETNGWKVAPMLDIAVVPAFGDKDAVANFTGGIEETTRVVDTNPIQATLGLNATVDAWTFGVNYGLTAGGDDRLNNSFNLNARYTF